MKTERFDRAMKGLVRGYMNDTLFKGSCCACAVGNVIAENCGYRILFLEEYSRWDGIYPAWQNVFTAYRGKQITDVNAYKGKAKRQIDSTGYTWQELARIEKAFECSTNMFDGLMSVVEILCDIEGINEVESYKEMFAK